ncbi:aminopeptidase [Aspergillus rambellii]|uniref:Aminopeptidase n=1 Tax=Aspergillus rambellii TaxID=308745 RepID=A0A0F8VUU5_9EURO|nr:aminopeptidase [Aspergillus rambellii]
MSRLSSTRLPLLLNSARPSPLSRFPLRALSRSLYISTPPSSLSPPSSTHRFPPRRSPLAQFSKRYCSYRRMCGSRRAEVSGSTTVPHGREVLPTNVKPLHYDLTLEPNFETYKYDGTVVIDLQVNEDTTSISLNTNELDIHTATVSSQGSVVTSSPDISVNEEKQIATIKFSDAVPAGTSAQLKLTFTGTLNDNMAGFYRSSYKTPSGETKYIASTQMEPTDARRAFPCFDEPALKAKFTVTLIADKSMTCLSNMDVASETEAEGGKKAVKFTTSPVMSTYLVAFIVGHLNYIETKAFRAFDSEFPLPKMDMVAVPDFSAGAMENWGLITYRIVDLLLDEKTSGASRKERIAETVQHELAHQWFGNLVTMDFWDGLWLNEGFATWMSWYSCNSFYPEWKVWQTYIIDNLQRALSLDSLRSSHPIEVPVKRADEINQIFDAISYSKGSSVLRMISKYLGEDVFLQGVRDYIKKHAYGNTQTGDLWAALANASGKPVEKVMDIWTKNVGFPVITVSEDPSSSTIKLKQNRFLRTGDVRPEEDTTLFPVMLGLRTQQGVDENTMLTQREGEFKVPNLDFFKLNADHSAIYRTSYSPERLAKLGEAARAGLLTVEDRAGMIADAGALAASGYQSTSGLLSLLTGFNKETEFIVWNEILTRVGTLRAAWMFEDTQTQDALELFERSLVSKVAHELGWTFSDTDSHTLQQYKSIMFAAAGFAGDKTVVEASKEMFERFSNGDTNAIHPNIRGSVFGIVLKYGGEKEYDVVLDRFRNAPTSDEKTTALRSLGTAEDPKLIQRSLALALGDEVKSQDIYMPLGGLRGHKAGVEARWAWLKDNWDAIYKRLPPGLGMLSSVVQISTASLCTEEQLKDVQSFFADKDTKGFDRAVDQSLDAIRAKISWVNRDRKDVGSWLKSNGYLGSGKL